MKKEYIKYGSITLITLFILIFIYPTIYRYDKLNQRTPVRINRITGTAETLSFSGWEKDQPTITEVPQISEMEQFKIEMKSKLESDEKILRQTIESEILANIKQQISDLSNATLDPNNKFSIGSTEDEVKKIMGAPTGIQSIYGGGDRWDYGYSYITFDSNKKVSSYSNNGKNLKIK